MNGKGNCYDIAVVENFIHALKTTCMIFPYRPFFYCKIKKSCLT